MDGDDPRPTSYGVYISQLIRFARVSSHVADFNAIKVYLPNFSNRAIGIINFEKLSPNVNADTKFNVGLKTLLHRGISEPEFYGDLVYKFKKIVGRADFSYQFRKIIVRYKRIGYIINIMRQSACLVFNPITVNKFASLFNCTPVGRASDSVMTPVESSSLFHHSIYLWFICFPWWSIDGLENLHAVRTTVCFEPWQKPRARLGSHKTGLSPPVFLYWPFQCATSVVVPYCLMFLLSVFILWFSYYVSDIF